jgi:glutamine synthetase
MSVKDALEMAKKNRAEIVDLKFVDFPGLWQHFSIPASELSAEIFEEGLGFDGSSIRGFQSINESDMILLPDPDTAMMDPFSEHPTLSLICNVLDAVTREPYTRDPRYVAQKAEKYLKSTGIADTSSWGRRSNFSSSTACASTRTTTKGTTTSTRWKGFGTPARTAVPTWATRFATRRATSRFLPWTSTRI